MSPKRRVVAPSPAPIAMKEIQLINRSEEMQVLREAVDRAVNGQGGVIFLNGEAGIGKTRLARELRAYAHARGMQVLSGRCPALFRMDGVPPYALWEEVIKDYLEVCTPEQLFRVIGSYPIEVSKLVPELKLKLRTFPQSFPLSPENSRDRLFEAVSQFITNISSEAPLLVILDDLQWTDQSSLLLLHYLARGIYRESLLLLGAYRDTYIDKKHPLSPVLRELNRERLLQSIPLKRLTFDDVSEMIRQILEQDEVPEEFSKKIFEKTRGNPFFLEEVIKSLKDEKVISREENKWRIEEVSRIEFPETVKDVIETRIDRLSEECQRVLTMASIIGKDFTFEALREATNIEEDELLEMMDKLIKTGLFKHTAIHGKDLFSFTDIIVRNVMLDEVGPLKRKKLHAIVGTALEKVYAENIDEHLGELALHFLECRKKEKALDYFLKAGEKAAKVYANTEAASYLQSALKVLEETEGKLQEIGRVLERLGDIKQVVGEHDACMKHWNKALSFWRQLHEKEKVSRLHRKMANILWEKIGDTEKAEEHHQKGLRILETEPENVELASLYEDMSHMYYRVGDIAKARTWAEKGLELAKKLDAHEVIASSYASLGTIFNFAGDKKKALECLEKALKIALDKGYMETALWTYNDLALALQTEEYERSFEYFKEGLELAKKVGSIRHISWIGANLVDLYLGLGNLKEAMSLAEESVALDRKAGYLTHLPISLFELGHAYQVAGEWDHSEQCHKEALSIAKRLHQFQQIALTYWYLGWLQLDKGEHAKAKESFEKSAKVCEKAGAKSYQMLSSAYLTWTYIELGELEKAENLIDKLHKFAREAKDKRLIAQVAMLRGMQYRAQKKWEGSIKHFEKSLHELGSLGARQRNIYWFAKTVLYEYARVYLERDSEGDREKACNLLNQALEIFQKMSAKKDIEKTKSRIAYAETRRRIVAPEPLAEIALPERITTGYEDLDDLLFGGIPRNYAVILTSPSCDERDLLIKRFLEAGAKEGQVTFHVIAKASGVTSLAEEFQSSFYLFVCNPEADAIIKSFPNVFKLKGVENLNDINIALSSAFRKLSETPKGPRSACIDIISDVLLQHHTVQTRRWLNALIPKLKAKGFTTLAVIDPEIHPKQELRAIVDVFEGEINVYEKQTKKGVEKFLKIKKMINRKYSKTELLLQKENCRKETERSSAL